MADERMTTVHVRTLDGEVWVNARHLVTRLREIGAEQREAAKGYGDPVPDEHYPTVVGYYAAALRLEETADRLDLALIAHVTESPGDSPLTPAG